MNLRPAELQILVVLDALLAEGSVTRAARRLNLTQPAVSQTLARARALFDDPLFVRANGRMVPTARAATLSGQLQGWMEATRDLLQPLEFDPATQKRDFVLASNDFAEFLLMPPVVAAARRMAPHVTLTLRSVESTPLTSEAVREGRVHLIISGIAPPPTFVEETLYEEHFVLLARHNHPALTKGLTATAFAAMDHALVSPQGIGSRGPIDEVLETLGLARRIVLSVSKFASLPRLLASSDIVAAVPSRFAETPEASAYCGSTVLPFPTPKFVMRLSWHRRFDTDPAHIWFRNLVLSQIRTIANHEP